MIEEILHDFRISKEVNRNNDNVSDDWNINTLNWCQSIEFWWKLLSAITSEGCKCHRFRYFYVIL